MSQLNKVVISSNNTSEDVCKVTKEALKDLICLSKGYSFNYEQSKDLLSLIKHLDLCIRCGAIRE